MADDTFWMVWNEGGSSPRVKHETKVFAIHEAERLARMNPGQRFVVMEAVAGRAVNDMQHIEYETQIPF